MLRVHQKRCLYTEFGVKSETWPSIWHPTLTQSKEPKRLHALGGLVDPLKRSFKRISMNEISLDEPLEHVGVLCSSCH